MKRLKNLLKFLIMALALFIGLWIAQDNPQSVDLTLLGFPLGAPPLGLTLIVAFALGLAAGMVASLPAIIRRTADNRRLTKTRDTAKPPTT